MIRFSRLILINLGIALGIPMVAFAGCSSDECLQNPLAFNDIPAFLAAVLRIVVQIVFPLIVLFFVFIGFKFVTASGPDELKKTRQLFFWAVVGALLVLGAQVLADALKATVDGIQRSGGG